jgi:hypothetical protein
MTLASASAPASYRAGTRRTGTAPAPHERRRRRGLPNREQSPLGSYADERGSLREVIACLGAAGSTLVIDRDRRTHGDARLVAHLGADEPAENAALTCERYLQDTAARGRRCRLLTAEDTLVAPFADQPEAQTHGQPAVADEPLQGAGGCSYSLELVRTGMSIPELRWCRRSHGQALAPEPLSLRETIAAMGGYEPMCALTLRALAANEDGREVSTTVLHAELARVQQSPIVLNRLLREAVLAVVARQESSLSEIALRCGRVKRDRKGNESGETSWLARRIGLLPEGGHDKPTPWIHSDVLGLIARRGLGISPHEVEP